MKSETLTSLTAGMPIPFGGNLVTRVSDTLAAAFQSGDRLIVVQDTGELLHVPANTQAIAAEAVSTAHYAFYELFRVSDAAISAFFEAFAARLEDDVNWAPIAAANAEDVAAAKAKGRSTTRLVATDGMRRDMVEGSRQWRDAEPSRGRPVELITHEGWSVEQLTAPLGVVGFVFEGRPNVFADAAGVLRGGNSVVFRIGSDALGTARAIVRHALSPALESAGLPPGACVLLDSHEHAAGWALFSDRRLSLAVARGSGQAVAQLGAVARQAGVPVSLHGTGGAWLVADEAADTARFEAAVRHSLDRKVCNTLNVCCIVQARAAELVPPFLAALVAAGDKRGHGVRLHVTPSVGRFLPDDWSQRVSVLPAQHLSREWEWDETPEVSLAVATDLEDAIILCNHYGPRLAASLISNDAAAHDRFYAAIDAPFVGDGMTRWVDGQYAFNRPELGLSNWEHGRLLARGGVLSGDSVYTIRTRMRQKDIGLHR